MGWFLIMVLVGDNLLYLAFGCAAQLRVVEIASFSHKLNLTVVIKCFVLLVLYSIGYNSLTYKFYRKRNASSGLYLCKPTLRGFVLEGYLFSLRNLVNGVIHGFLLDHHLLQISALTAVSGILAFMIVHYRRQFICKFAFLMSLLYHLSFFTFNALILMGIKKVDFLGFDYQSILYELMLTSLAITVLRFLAEVFNTIKDLKAKW